MWKISNFLGTEGGNNLLKYNSVTLLTYLMVAVYFFGISFELNAKSLNRRVAIINDVKSNFVIILVTYLAFLVENPSIMSYFMPKKLLAQINRVNNKVYAEAFSAKKRQKHGIELSHYTDVAFVYRVSGRLYPSEVVCLCFTLPR